MIKEDVTMNEDEWDEYDRQLDEELKMLDTELSRRIQDEIYKDDDENDYEYIQEHYEGVDNWS